MMSRDPIVAGTDGSPTAQLAVERAAELAQALGADVHVVSAHPSISAADRMTAIGGFGTPPVTCSGEPMAPLGTVAVAERVDVEQAQMAAEKIVSRTGSRLESWGIAVETHVGSGEPAQVLIAVAEDERAQMIVVGNRGMTGVHRLLGSVPNRVAHHAPCDVLIVPIRLRSRRGGASFWGGPIIVGTDGSGGATRALHEAIRLAKALESELRIVASHKPYRRTRASGAPEAGAEVWAPLSDSLVESVLEQGVAEARADGVKATTSAPEDDPADALLQIAAKNDAAMIVVGSKGIHGAKRVTLGNVPNQISHKGVCSVLIVPDGLPESNS
jgi:nucleotide-binding universal stress UspA family protein